MPTKTNFVIPSRPSRIKDYNRAHYLKNRAVILAKRKLERSKQGFKERMSQYKRERAASIIASRRLYYELHKEQLLQEKKLYRQLNKKKLSRSIREKSLNRIKAKAEYLKVQLIVGILNIDSNCWRIDLLSGNLRIGTKSPLRA
jgi:hypothetical protein